jgi:hypothetical protein
VINELNGQGSLQDYIELFNTGTTSFDLSGYSITQGVGPTGPADVTKGLVFPAGTSLDAGGYLLVVANQPSRDGPHAHCNVVPGFPDIVCYFVDWGISKTNGDSVYLLAPNSTTFDTAMFPPVGPAQPPDGRSYGRYPDGAGAFQPTMWTPGASNQLQ